MIEEIFDKLINEVSSTYVSDEVLMKEYYKSLKDKRLVKSTYTSEQDWYKFWLLTDGTIVPVVNTHSDTAWEAEANFDTLVKEGAIPGYFDTRGDELGLRYRVGYKPTSEQISAVSKLYRKWLPSILLTDFNLFSISNSSDLTNVLRYGKGREKKPWESIKEAKVKEQGGWILPNGKMEFLDPYYQEAHWEDAFRKLKKKTLYTGKAGADAADEYMKKGNIRFSLEGTREVDLMIKKEPTEAQRLIIGKLAREYWRFFADIIYPGKRRAVYSWEEFRKVINEVRVSKHHFDCMDCGVNTDAINEYYMVKPSVWKAAVPDKEKQFKHLCIGCLEKRLGRKLTPEDFPNYPINTEEAKRSERLKDRMGLTEGFKKHLATAAATGILGGAAMLGALHKAGKAGPNQGIPTSPKAAHQKAIEDPNVDMDKIADIESAQDPNAENKRTGARGLLQIMKPTWEEITKKMGVDWSWDEAFDEEKNNEVGSYYMNTEIPRLLGHYGLDDTIENRLAAYNWGVGNLKKYRLKNAPEETKNYIRKYLGTSTDEKLLGEAKGITLRSVDRKGEQWWWEDDETGEKSELFNSLEAAQDSANKHLEKVRGKKFKQYKTRYFGEAVAKEQSGGWIVPSGKIEYFNEYHPGKHWEEAYKRKYKHNPNMEDRKESIVAIEAAEEYAKKGNIRFILSPSELNVEVKNKKPTPAQMQSISKLSKAADNFVFAIDTDTSFESGYDWRNFRKYVSKMQEVREAVATEELSPADYTSYDPDDPDEEGKVAYVPNKTDLLNFLRYGKGRQKKAWEAVVPEKETMEIPLSNTDKVAIIDKEDYDKVKDYSWFLKKDKRTQVEYVATSKRIGNKVKTIRLHRLIMDVTDPMEDVHHKDLDVLNNTKSNLEVLPRAEHRLRHMKKREPHYYDTAI